MIQLIRCTGRRYLLHLLPPEVNRQRGLGDKRHRLVIQLHPVLMFQNEWMEELTYLSCIASRCCHLALRPGGDFFLSLAPQERVVPVDRPVPKPSVDE